MRSMVRPKTMNSQQSNIKRTTLKIALISVAMFGFAFVLVPIFNVVCDVTGLNGKLDLTQPASRNSTAHVDMTREVEVIFLATKNEQLPWEFKPQITRVTLHPGEDKQLAYFARNNTDHRMTVQAVPSVTPGFAAKYIKKTECFCFTQQTFDAEQGQDMPLILRVDPSLPKEVKTIILSYTLFDASQFAGKMPAKIPGHVN